jgi:DNA-binding MarR family transcriptional regulator
MDFKNTPIDVILDLSERVAIALLPSVPQDLPLPDLTMKQFRVAMFLFLKSPMRMNCIAQFLGVSMATASGIVSRLVEHEIVERDVDPEDRRAVICQLSSHGREILGQTWQSFRSNTRMILNAIPKDKIHFVEKTMNLLLETSYKLKNEVLDECDNPKNI